MLRISSSRLHAASRSPFVVVTSVSRMTFLQCGVSKRLISSAILYWGLIFTPGFSNLSSWIIQSLVPFRPSSRSFPICKGIFLLTCLWGIGRKYNCCETIPRHQYCQNNQITNVKENSQCLMNRTTIKRESERAPRWDSQADKDRARTRELMTTETNRNRWDHQLVVKDSHQFITSITKSLDMSIPKACWSEIVDPTKLTIPEKTRKVTEIVDATEPTRTKRGPERALRLLRQPDFTRTEQNCSGHQTEIELNFIHGMTALPTNSAAFGCCLWLGPFSLVGLADAQFIESCSRVR